MPLPSAPHYAGFMKGVYDRTLTEADIFKRYEVDGLIVENFLDNPLFPGRIPAVTVASLAVLTREIKRSMSLPVGVNARRNEKYPTDLSLPLA
jgi:predicted TIM-barrel enzyme